jgi:imidazolonepropionase-like amidohydrolase
MRKLHCSPHGTRSRRSVASTSILRAFAGGPAGRPFMGGPGIRLFMGGPAVRSGALGTAAPPGGARRQRRTRRPAVRSVAPGTAVPLLVALVATVSSCEPAPVPSVEDVPDPVTVADAGVPPRATVAFEDVTVVSTETEELLPGMTVLVEDGRIAAVGPAGEVEVPEGAIQVDGEGRYLVPGLAEMHGHLPGGNADAEMVANILFLYVANGVTLVRGMQGHPEQLRIREAVEEGSLLGPRLILGSPAQGWGNVPEAEEAPDRVREFREAGFDLVKVGEGPDPEAYQALAEAARNEGLALAGHVPDEVGLRGVLEAGQVTIDHLDNYVEELIPEEERQDIAPLWGVAEVAHLADESRIQELVAATVEAGTAQVPTMVLWEVFFGDRPGEELRQTQPETRYMPPELVEGWIDGVANRHEAIGDHSGAARVVELRRRVFQALHQGGAEFLLGTDSPQLFSVPGFANHREMQLWVELGMTPWEVLQAGTWNVAAHFGELDEAGSVAEGKRADLILLEANPLDDIGNVARRAGVVVDGRWLPETEIQARLEAIAQGYAEARDGDPVP